MDLQAELAGARLPVRLDIGFGDPITPGAIEVEYPSLLDRPRALLLAYPPETVVAEKLQAMVELGMRNSRMKDFYDLWAISETFSAKPPCRIRTLRIYKNLFCYSWLPKRAVS